MKTVTVQVDVRHLALETMTNWKIPGGRGYACMWSYVCESAARRLGLPKRPGLYDVEVTVGKARPTKLATGE